MSEATLVTVPPVPERRVLTNATLQAEIEAFVAATPADKLNVDLTWSTGNDLKLIAVRKIGEHVTIDGYVDWNPGHPVDAGLQLRGMW